MIDFDSKIAALEEKRKPLFVEPDALNEKISRIYKQIEKLREQKEKEQMKQPMSAVEEMEYFLFEDGNVSGERYKAREKYWHDKGLWHSGYFPEIEQINLKMMLYKGENDNLEQTVSVLEQVIPLLKVDQGVKHLGVFEHTCSEHGSYSVEIKNSSFDLIVWHWSRKSTVKSFDNLCDLVKYVQEHHYYQDSESDQYSDDD